MAPRSTHTETSSSLHSSTLNWTYLRTYGSCVAVTSSVSSMPLPLVNICCTNAFKFLYKLTLDIHTNEICHKRVVLRVVLCHSVFTNIIFLQETLPWALILSLSIRKIKQIKTLQVTYHHGGFFHLLLSLEPLAVLLTNKI